jgi:hypothetical protein
MASRKDLVIAVLATFCLTATLFMIIPTRSQIGGYDPWADINDDGKIDMYDIGHSARLFGATGDATKNVNVTNFPTQQREPAWKVIQVTNTPDGELNLTTLSEECNYRTSLYESEGYSHMYICMKKTNVSYTDWYKTRVWISRILWQNRYITFSLHSWS